VLRRKPSDLDAALRLNAQPMMGRKAASEFEHALGGRATSIKVLGRPESQQHTGLRDHHTGAAEAAPVEADLARQALRPTRCITTTLLGP
jgi:hypothetical protein